jgi:hypothetical protein
VGPLTGDPTHCRRRDDAGQRRCQGQVLRTACGRPRRGSCLASASFCSAARLALNNPGDVVSGAAVWASCAGPGAFVSESHDSEAGIEALGVERGRRALTASRKGGKTVTIPLAPRTNRAVDLAVGERCAGRIFTAPRGRLDRHGAARVVRRVARRTGIAKSIGPRALRHAFITAALDAGSPCGTCTRPPPTRIRAPHAL